MYKWKNIRRLAMAVSFAIALMLCTSHRLRADTPPAVINATSTGNNGAAPIGIAATANKLLFTQPFCAGQQARGIYSASLTGTASLTAAIPEEGPCSENYLAIATSVGGFTAGDTYATGVSSTNSNNEAVYKNGSTLFVDNIPASEHHAGVTFDTVGSFGFTLIVTAEGSVIGYNSAGAVQFTYPAPSGYVFEGATVAPLTYSSCPGCLFITGALHANINNASASGNGEIYLVQPGTPSGTPVTLWSSTPGPEPEGLVVVPNNLSCTLPASNGYSYFVSGYATGAQFDSENSTSGAILAYTPAQLAPYAGQLLVPHEGSLAVGPGTIYAFSGPNASTVFSTTNYQLEGSTILTCPSGGCPATQGFWKHHAFPSAMFVGGRTSIGCQTYTAAELVTILQTPPAGGNAVLILGHQLIAAIANYDNGAVQTPAATAAISTAITLLCTNNLNLSTSSVAASSPLGQQLTALANILDSYNSSTPNGCKEGTPGKP